VAIASIRVNSWASGAAPSVSTRALSMKLAYRSAIFCDSEPGSSAAASSSSTIVRTSVAALSASMSKVPKRERSAGMSVVRNHSPFTWPNRSSCGRTLLSYPASCSPDVGVGAGGVVQAAAAASPDFRSS